MNKKMLFVIILVLLVAIWGIVKLMSSEKALPPEDNTPIKEITEKNEEIITETTITSDSLINSLSNKFSQNNFIKSISQLEIGKGSYINVVQFNKTNCLVEDPSEINECRIELLLYADSTPSVKKFINERLQHYQDNNTENELNLQEKKYNKDINLKYSQTSILYLEKDYLKEYFFELPNNRYVKADLFYLGEETEEQSSIRKEIEEQIHTLLINE